MNPPRSTRGANASRQTLMASRPRPNCILSTPPMMRSSVPYSSSTGPGWPHVGQYLVQEVFDEDAGGLDHVLHHGRVIVDRIREAVEAEHISDQSDHRTAMDSQRVVALLGMFSLEGLDINASLGIVTAEALLFASCPVARRLDRRS